LDLFESEQKIFDNAVKRVEEVRNGDSFSFEEYESLAKEYGKLLKQLRKSIYFADRISNGLYKNNLILDDKVHFDALTGIYNRRFMDDNLKRVIKSLSRSKGMLSVMMLDIDFFKKYNDTYGHKMGDICLQSVAKALSGTARMDDCVIRYGGEEFVVLLPNTDETGAGITAARLLECIRALRIPHKNSDIAEYVTISIGATTGKVKPYHQYMDYIERADEALYLSKNSGRNKYTHLKYSDKRRGGGNEVQYSGIQ
jgi:diguanylate cyclase (GGDEF)-like protein